MRWITMSEPEELFKNDIHTFNYVAVLFKLLEELGHRVELTPIEKVSVNYNYVYLLWDFESLLFFDR